MTRDAFIEEHDNFDAEYRVGAYVLLDDGEVAEPELVEVDEPAPESYRRRRRTSYGWTVDR